MPEERIVNRVSQPAQDGAPKISPVTSVWANPDWNPEWNESPVTASAQRAGQVGEIVEQKAELASDFIKAKAELERSAPLIAEVLQNKFLTRDPDLAEFKKQVIAAFKHLGLDTKQFFGV